MRAHALSIVPLPRAGAFIQAVMLIVASGLAISACGDDKTTGPPICTAACDTPPAAVCVDASVLRSFASPGACGTDGACTYGHVDLTCEHGCEAGACKGVVDPCADVTCTTPPAAACDGDSLTTYASLGTCAAGNCSYGSVAIPCSHGCANGACAGDPCADVTCNTPPSPCHAATGTCTSGVCSYVTLAGADCDDGQACTQDDSCSAAGTCVGTAIACQSPPAPECAGSTLRVAAANGACVSGGCDYPVTEVACPEGCQNGACLGDPCENVVCTTPPSGCYAATGTCENGVCAYAFDNGASCDDGVACTDGDTCTNGTCAGTQRSCVTPDPASCKDADTLIARASSGACDDGACSYVAIEVPCAFGCVTVDGVGRCEGDPCGGVTCTTPALAECANTTSLVVPAAIGVCAGGNCNYDNVVFTCAHGCQARSGNTAGFCKPPVGLVISEVLVDSQGFPDTNAFVEIHGPAGTELDGLTIVGVNGNGGGDYNIVALTGTLDSQGLFVVAHPDAEPAIADVADLLDEDIDYQNGPDTVQLRFGGVVLDALAYGNFDAGDIGRGEGTPHAVATVDQSLFRDSAYADTNDNAVDFAAGSPTPAAPTPVAETAPVAALVCPAGGLVGDSLFLDASASTGDIASYTFDFGDTSDDVTSAVSSVMHTFTAAGTYQVTVTATTAGGLSDDASCDVTVTSPETPATYTGMDQCFDGTGGAYLYDVLSNPVAATTDGLLTVRFRGTSPYGPKPYVIELQTGADVWVKVATTNDSKMTINQTERFRVPKATIEAAIAGMGWIRFRHSYQYNGSSNDCMQLTFQYNCESCFACPAGEADLGIGCRPTNAAYDYTSLEHTTGKCGAESFADLYLPGAPQAAGDGTFSIDFLGCGGVSINLEMFTTNSDWVDIGSGSAPSCSFGTATWTIPEAYLDAAVGADNKIRFRWDLNDTCAGGTGCESFNDPCVRNAHLTYPR